MPIEIDNRGNWVVNVEKINISQGTKVNTTQSLTDNNSITDNADNFNPDVNNHEDNVLFQKNVKPAYEYDYIHNDITGEKIDIVMNNDIKVDKIKPQKISDKLPFEISQKPADNKKAIISSLKLNNGNTIKTINKNINQYEIINKNTIEKSISNLYKHDVDYSDKIVILYNIKKLCENAHLILSHKDTKQNTQTIIKRFANIARVNSKDYLVEIICKDNGELSIYSINPINTKNDGNQKRLDKSQQLDTVNNSITYIKDLFKSKIVEKYNKDYKNSQSQSDVYFQPAYHGTPHRFNNFSTEYIGTGEKAQAHGWGLYFAENKDISENYRENLLAHYYPEAIDPTIPEKL